MNGLSEVTTICKKCNSITISIVSFKDGIQMCRESLNFSITGTILKRNAVICNTCK